MKKNVPSLLFLFFISLSLLAQPSIKWSKSFGGSNNEEARSILQTGDGGYVVVGETNSTDGDVYGNHGESDYWVVKLNSRGTLQWQKCLGGSKPELIRSIQQTSDGGFIIAGTSNSNDSDVTGNQDGGDYWVVKLNSEGNIEWQKCYGGTDADEAYSIRQTMDGGYVVAGSSFSTDGDVSGNYGYADFWIVKLNNMGSIQWQKCLGGTDSDEAYSIQQTTDSGYIVAGTTFSSDSNVSYNYGGADYWVVKLNGEGSIQWQKSFGSIADEQDPLIKQTTDGGYVFVGSFDGIIPVDIESEFGFNDYWLVKFDKDGEIKWQKCLSGTGQELFHSLQLTADSGFIVAGSTILNDPDEKAKNGSMDCWIIKMDKGGSISWQKSFGGTGDDQASSIQQTSDGGYVVAGSSFSSDGEVSRNHGGADFWVVKLDPYIDNRKK